MQRLSERWVKLHDKERHALYSSANVIRMSKGRTVGRAGHVAEEKCIQNVGRET